MTDINTNVKLFLRVSSASADAEIQQTIDACLLDLRNAGVSSLDTDDPLIQQAVKLYCKAQFGFSADSEKYERAYEHLKASLSLSSDYSSSM